MQLFTASYAAWRPEHGQPVATSLLLPRWLPEAESWPRCWLLTPTWKLFKAGGEEFARGFEERLDRFGPQRIARALHAIAAEHQADRLVLLCFEANANNCHRRQVADWLLSRTGERVTEVGEEVLFDS